MNTLKRYLSGVGNHYDYSPGHRLVELMGIAACLVLMGLLGWRLAHAVALRADLVVVGGLAAASLAGYVAADLVSGVVHWLADRFGTPATPVVGQAFVRPFREHHDRPREILEHDFVEVNGNNCLVMILFLAPVHLALPETTHPGWVGFAGFALVFALAIFLTNQFHKWAHTQHPPKLVRWLQRHRLVLSPEAHDRHHTAPYETDYCITSGWLNPVLERLEVFARCERILKEAAPVAQSEEMPERSRG